VLAAAVAVLGLSIVSGMIFKPVLPSKPAYVVEGVEADPAAGAAVAAVAEKPIEAYLSAASAEKGAAIFKKCAACHTIEKGQPAGIGPNLYGVLGGPHAHMQGFGYSDAMAATHDKTWGWDEINKWLTSPKAYIPGNKMAFAGLSKPEDRADVITYLNSKSDKPLPVPAAPPEAPAADAAAPAAAGTTPATTEPAPGAGKAPDVPVADAKTAAAQPEKVGGPASPNAGTQK
jgi:cytochrome c